MNKPFNMTVAEMRNEVATADENRKNEMAAEIERRIAKRKLNGKAVPNKLFTLLVELKE